MNKSFTFGNFTPALFAWTVIWGMLTTTATIPSGCEAQEVDGIERLRSMLQHIEFDHNPGPCATCATPLGPRALSREAVSNSDPVNAPLQTSDVEVGIDHEVVEEIEVSLPFQSPSDIIDQSPQVRGVLTPIVDPATFEPLPADSNQFGISPVLLPPATTPYIELPPADGGFDSHSTIPLSASKAARLWQSYCTEDNSYHGSTTACGFRHGCRHGCCHECSQCSTELTPNLVEGFASQSPTRLWKPAVNLAEGNVGPLSSPMIHASSRTSRNRFLGPK